MDEIKVQKNTSCKDSVMSRIECGEVCQRSKVFFRTRECAVWALWAVSVIVGALAVSVTLFVLTHSQYALYEATHDNFLTFMAEVLPLVWIIVFAAMAGLGVYELRRTKRGYKYPLWQIFASSVVLSLAGGAALQFFGLGYATDHMLGIHMNMYNSQEKIEKRMWQNPHRGRLVGQAEEAFVPPATGVRFKDLEGKVWQASVQDLSKDELELLSGMQPVRMFGIVMDEQSALFHPCHVFIHKSPNEHSLRDLKQERMEFISKVARVKEIARGDQTNTDPCLRSQKFQPVQ
jgi:hypothetical protein